MQITSDTYHADHRELLMILSKYATIKYKDKECGGDDIVNDVYVITRCKIMEECLLSNVQII